MRRPHFGLVAFLTLALGACSGTFACNTPPAEAIPDPLSNARPVRPGDVPEDRMLVIAFLGDSITAGLGLTSQQAYPSLIQAMFAAEGYGEVESLNGGVSGDTTAGGLRRVDQLLGNTTKILVVALGGNDALRGLTATQTHDNIAAIIDEAQSRGVAVLLAGMEAPTNLGDDYRTAFRGAFIQLSRQYEGTIEYVPFLLEGVAANPALNQSDGIHPNADGARVIAELLYPRLRNIVDRLSSSR
jgi:acyl-CoA thioesterase I